MTEKETLWNAKLALKEFWSKAEPIIMKNPLFSKVHQELREAIYVIDITENFELSEREIDNIVIEIAKDQNMYNAIQAYIENPLDENNINTYDNIVNTKLITTVNAFIHI